MEYKSRSKSNTSDTVIAILLILITLTCLLPVLNTIAISFSNKTDAAIGKVFFWPVRFTVAPYISVWKEKQFFRSFENSVWRVLLGGVINVALTILMAYPLSRNRRAFPAKYRYLWFIIFTMIFYGGLIPNFLLIRYLGLMDTIWALVLPGAVPVFSVIILMNYFKDIPIALEEAAYVDGANPFYILWRIFVPLAKPAIAAIALFSVVYHWNSFFDGKIYINTPEKMPLQTYIQSLTVDISSQMQYMTPEEIQRRLEMSNMTFNSAKIVVSMVPILLIYPLLQRYFVTGIVMGAVKE